MMEFDKTNAELNICLFLIAEISGSPTKTGSAFSEISPHK